MTKARTIAHWINGRTEAGSATRHGPVFNPATGEQAASVPMANRADMDAALAAASAAFPGWAATPAVKRARVMFRFKELIEQHRAEIVGLITAEHGKVLSDADGSLQRGLEVVEFACGIPHLLKGDFSSDLGRGVDCHSLREPLGVCAGISPFNFPAMVPMWMFPLAIACGNAFVMKPSEKDPSCAVRLAELLHEAGLPPGVLNVVHGDKEAVDALLHDARVSAISFVGSTPVAEYVYRQAAEQGMRAQSLGGAKNHMVILPDADIEQAADALIGAAYGSAGERCMAISVAVAVGDAGDQLRDAQCVYRGRAGRRGRPGCRRARSSAFELGRRILSRADLIRSRSHADAYLPGRNFRAGIDDAASRKPRCRPRNRKRPRICERCCHIHAERKGSA
jgi:malonate-semialdehyde dehydrogenase (acetylating)/methylmalonate-semialdehyde dehydrogenase